MKIEYRVIAVIVLGLLASGQGRAETNVADAAKGAQQAARRSAAAADHGAQPVSGKPKRVNVRPLAGPTQNQRSVAVHRFTPIAPKANGVAGVSGSIMGRHVPGLAALGGRANTMPKAGAARNTMGPRASAMAVLGGRATFDAKKLVRR